MNDLQIFGFENKEVRVVMEDGEPWFVAKDVAEALGYVWNGTECIRHVPKKWQGVRSVLTPGGIQEMLCLAEQGLYFFLGRSDKKAALPFQEWYAGEVIPSIRKTGTYSLPGRGYEDPLAEWKRNCPYPFFAADDAAAKILRMCRLMDKGVMTPKECRKVMLNTGKAPYTPEASIKTFIQKNIKITDNMSDYVKIADLFSLYEEQHTDDVSQQKLTRGIREIYPALKHKQKKIDGYPVLVFCGCTLKKVSKKQEAGKAEALGVSNG